MFRVDITGDSLHLMQDRVELVMWTREEWEEDPSLVLNIANAIRTGYEEGAGAVRAILQQSRSGT